MFEVNEALRVGRPRVLDRCLQLFGGYGLMAEYPIACAYADARVSRIYGGANEIVGRSLELAPRAPARAAR